MVANVDRMAHVGEMPWHKQSTYIGEGEVESAVMMEKSGLNFELDFAPLQAVLPSGAVDLPNGQVIYRTDTGKILSKPVTARFGFVQPVEHWSFFDAVIDKGMYYHTAGSLGDGEKIWILAKLPESFTPVKGDEIEQYILLSDSFAGDGKAFQMQFTPIRVVCQNTLNAALADVERGMRAAYRKVHKTGMTSRLDAEDARLAIGLAGKFFNQFQDAATAMAKTKMTAQEIEDFIKQIAPIPTTKLLQAPRELREKVLALPAPDESLLMDYITPQLRTKREHLAELIETGKGTEIKGVKGTRWAAYNGVVEYYDYVAGRDGTRTESLLFGTARAKKQEAFDILTAGV